jgi:phenylalanyl-tRNA synthetase beta chain
MGLREIQTNSMMPVEKARSFLTGDDERAGVVQTLKPISEAMAALRPRLLPGALEAMRFNRNRGQETLRFFEFGHVFRKSAPGDQKGSAYVPGYAEHEALLVALRGPAQTAGWNSAARNADFYDAKGIVERLLADLRIANVQGEPFGPGADLNFDYGLRFATGGGDPLGVVGEVEGDTAAGFDLEGAVFAAELRWEALVEVAAPREERRYAPPRRFPAVERDLAVVVAEQTPAEAVRRTIERAAGALLQSARLFDLYAGEGVDKGRKSLAFALRFQADRTLEDAEVDAEVERIVSSLKDEHDAELRG